MKPDHIKTYFTDNEALLAAVKACSDLKTLEQIANESKDRFERLRVQERQKYLPALVADIRNFIDAYGNIDVFKLTHGGVVSLLVIADALENGGQTLRIVGDWE